MKAHCEILPKQLLHVNRRQLEELGFRFHDDVDDLFVRAALPEGWEKRASPQSPLWSEIVDGQGRKRFSVFYRADYYDRSAAMTPTTRYTCEVLYVNDTGIEVHFDSATAKMAIVEDAAGSRLYETMPIRIGAFNNISSVLREECEQWLHENYPDWRNPFAYW